MDNFIVSARKYRPTSWNTVVGQDAITTTLQNAIKNNHLAQAYLFCGPRGVGKTTCARIFAHVINDADEQADMSYNVFELDAASNNSVDDIRNLTDQVRVPPQTGKYKVYIIDEVHMLSQAAFNAFLKTLEEPPKHAIFILATTEKHKIIPTILSRCQIFDFNRIMVDDIASYLTNIAEKEKVIAEEDSIHIIAQKADGAMRDALSIFDQLVSFAGNNLTYEAVISNLNILDYDYYFKFVEAINNGDIPSSLLLFDEVLNRGFDGHNFIVGLGEHFRNLLVCKDQETVKLLEVGVNIRQRYLQQGTLLNANTIITALNIISQTDVAYKTSKNQRLLVELCLLKLSSISGIEKKNNSAPVAIAEPTSITATKPDSAVENKVAEKQPNYSNVETAKIPSPAITPSSTATNPVSAIPKITPTPEDITENKPNIKVNKIKTGIISITESLNLEVEEEADGKEDEKNIESEKYSKDDFAFAWKEYADKVKADGHDSWYSTLVNHPPQISPEHEIILVIDNDLQDKMVINERKPLLEYLRNRLHNTHIKLKVVMIEGNSENLVLSGPERFKELAKKNPVLLDLKKDLDLDIEY